MLTFTSLVAAALAIWAIVAVAKSSIGSNQKTLWFAIVIVIPILGPTLYYLFGNKNLSS